MRILNSILVGLLCLVSTFCNIDISTVVEQVKNANVAILEKGGGKVARYRAVGTGFILDHKRGIIMTAAHVLQRQLASRDYDNKPIHVRLFDGRRTTAKLLLLYGLKDIAIIQLNKNMLVSLPLPESYSVSFGLSSLVKYGETVFSVGNPRGNLNMVTMGAVSSLNKTISMPVPMHYTGMIVHDNTINGGNSGGALYNRVGEVIGMTVATLGETMLSVSVPSDILFQAYTEYFKHSRVFYPILGVRLKYMDQGETRAHGLEKYGTFPAGLKVSKVHPGTPAHKAGIRPGDVITHVNGELVTGPSQLRTILCSTPSGESIELKVVTNRLQSTKVVTPENGYYDLRLTEIHTGKPKIGNTSPFVGRSMLETLQKPGMKRPPKPYNPYDNLPKNIGRVETIAEVQRRQFRALLGEWSVKAERQKAQKRKKTIAEILFLDYIFLKTEEV